MIYNEKHSWYYRFIYNVSDLNMKYREERSMQNNLLKKGLLVGIIVLFIGVSIIPSVPSEQIEQTTTGHVITVDDEGDGDYVTIKEAVNNANPGDTIEVYSGTYPEHWNIIEKEHINLIGISHELGEGNDSGKPFVKGDGTGTVFHVKVGNVSISNFRIENPWSGGLFVYCIRLGEDVANKQSNNIIFNNTLSNSTRSAIYCAGAGKDIKIIGNEISHCNNSGILVDVTEGFIITGNIITDVDKQGILFSGEFHNISGNIIKRCGIGIKINGNYNTIYGNNIENCVAGVFIDGTCGNTITENNFKNNSKSGYWWDRYLGTCLGSKNKNRWNGNYWDGWIGVGPKVIIGHLIIWIPIFFEVLEIPIPWLDFDWTPAKEPYDIRV